MQYKTVLELRPESGNPRNSEGDFITLKNGKILFVFTQFQGSSNSDFGHAQLASRYSSDRGESWSVTSQKVVGNEGKMSVMSVSLVRLHSGRIALFYVRKNSIHDCQPMLRFSEDEGESWSEPISCIRDRKGYFVLNNSRVIQLEDGRLLMPVALHETRDVADDSEEGLLAAFNDFASLYCYYSDDEGLSWSRSDEVPVSEGIMGQEPGVVALQDGKIMMYFRTDSGCQYASYSDTFGKSWSMSRATDILSPLSSATIGRVPGCKDLILVWDDNHAIGEAYHGKRSPLRMAISKDEADTWETMHTLEDDPDGTFCYTAIHFLDRQSFVLGYCAGKGFGGKGLAVTKVVKVVL